MKNILLSFFAFILVSCSTSTTNPVDYGSNSKVGKYIKTNDIKLYYEIYGEGEPLLLLHGNGGSIENFIFQIPEFSKYFKVIAVDSRAQGRTSDSDKEISYALMASDMSELLDKLNIGKVNVVGWSDGGNIGLELAYSHPEKVMKLVTFGANYSNENFMVADDSIDMNADDPLIVQTIAIRKQKALTASKRLTPIPEKTPSIQKKLNDLMEKYPTFTTEQLKQIKVPTLIIIGDHDLINPKHTISLFENLPHSQLFVVPGASHAVPREQPDLINSEVIKFLNTPYRDIDPYYFFKIPR
jgi:pimeloyl-ACP methyl ester carboxylesterase